MYIAVVMNDKNWNLPVTQVILPVTFAFFSLWPINTTLFCLECKSHSHPLFFSTFAAFWCYCILKKEFNCASFLSTLLHYSQENTLQIITAQIVHKYVVFGPQQTEQLFSVAPSKEWEQLLCAINYCTLVWHCNLKCKCVNRSFSNACRDICFFLN